jgi:hypothetical protein
LRTKLLIQKQDRTEANRTAYEEEGGRGVDESWYLVRMYGYDRLDYRLSTRSEQHSLVKGGSKEGELFKANSTRILISKSYDDEFLHLR